MNDAADRMKPASVQAPRPIVGRLAMVLGAASASAFVLLLGVRTLTTPDLGYHLAYGEHLLDTGEIVDRGRFLHRDALVASGSYDLPPGAWYDATGAYRFPNANWLSQAIMAWVHRRAGPAGLSVLLAGLVAGIFALQAATMRRVGLGPVAISAGLVLTALVAYERFLLRPEVFGYLVAMAQMWLLSRWLLPPRGSDSPDNARARAVGWGPGAGLIALQALLVNLHSYFLVGLALTGAVLVGRLLARRSDRHTTDHRAGTIRLAVVLAGQVIVCFANPWTFRLAVLPVRTLLFMQANHIAGGELVETGHPWAVIGEFFRPFAPGVFQESKASYAYCVLLGLAGAGIVGAAARRRWGELLIVLAMTGASLSMRRNIAPAALLVVPLSLSNGLGALRAVGRRLGVRPGAGSLAVLGGTVAVVSIAGIASVVTNRFYWNERRAVRFGLGLARTVVPVAAAEWINTHQPRGRLWSDYNSSSNTMYFTRPHRDVPVLTNTWAYPPDAMGRVLDTSRGRRPLAGPGGADDYEIVVLRMDRTSIPLARSLVRDVRWALVHLDALHVVFVRADGANAELARRCRITPETLDVPALQASLARMDPVGGYAAYLGAFTLSHLGWDIQAVQVIDDVLARWPRGPHRHRMWNMKGTCLARRGTLRMLRKPRPNFAGKQDWHEARNCFLQALRIDADYQPARRNLAEINRQIADEKRGVLYTYPW